MQHEGIGVPSQFGNDEWHPLSHEAGDEGNVAREAIELRDQDAASGLPGGCQRSSELRAPIESVGTLASLGLDELGNDPEILCFDEAFDGGPLRLNAQARALLLPCGDTIVGNSAFHTKGIPPFALWMNPLSEQCHCCFHVAQQREHAQSLAKNAHNRVHARISAF
jgi:hypothetical protein